MVLHTISIPKCVVLISAHLLDDAITALPKSLAQSSLAAAPHPVNNRRLSSKVSLNSP
jgi:hypothetical protein